ncbi:DUF2846 domain-containing protein [Ralstonia sp. ASV6]|uniref:DUF2846 domain-containing protein n=1 Tax=Ralstonia sp. ASV6 TaxID=2795124 RepID=UPI0018ECA399|nr:DUF2846 domain-containing protein [Ralstonia sp. ASV6]
MKGVLRALASAIGITVLMAGCASGVKYSEMASTIPTLKQDQGRVYFFRSSSLMGAGIQPDIKLNDAVVGQSRPGGFFYVDRPAGKYLVSTASETEKTLSFALDAGETKYVRTSAALGLIVYRIVPELETPEKAQSELPSLSFAPNEPPAAKK